MRETRYEDSTTEISLASNFIDFSLLFILKDANNYYAQSENCSRCETLESLKRIYIYIYVFKNIFEILENYFLLVDAWLRMKGYNITFFILENNNKEEYEYRIDTK